MLKSIKKKDSIELFIDSRNPTDLGIKVVPREKNRITNSTVKIQTIQNTYMELPKGYDKPVIVPSIEYQKMCKDMNNIGSTIRVISRGFQVEFKCNTANVYSRGTLFGEIDEDDDEEDEDFEIKVDYDEDFDTEQLTRIIKIAGLSSNMQIYPKEDCPLLFKSLVGSLGTISIYIKSKKEIEKDESEYDRGDSDYED
jgi:proliferating cell nuclear antigen